MRKFFYCIIFFLGISFAANAETSGFYRQGFSKIVEPLMPAVVNIYTSVKKPPSAANAHPFRHMQDDPFAKFFEQFDFPFGFDDLYQDPKSNALGSGFIIDEAGHIVTNNHLVKGADEINVKLNDNKEYPAKLIGTDQKTDLALLKITSEKPLPFVKFGDSSQAKIGDWVIAIGNPFGLGGSVTAGIISSKGRDIGTYENGIVDDYIQTDAAINMGNSGGPMFNMDGEVIGVNTSIFSNSGSNIGIGFAIPSSTVQNVVEILKKHGKVERGFLGVNIQEVSPQMAEAMNLKSEEGVLVVDINPKGAGAKAGLKPGDVIVELDSKQVKNSRKLQIMVADTPVGKSVTLTVMRSGKMLKLDCKLVPESSFDTPRSVQNQSFSAGDSFELKGLVFSNNSSGVIVSRIEKRAEWKMLKVGDVVISVNQQPVSNVKELEKIYNYAVSEDKKHIVLFVKRHNSKIFLALPI